MYWKANTLWYDKYTFRKKYICLLSRPSGQNSCSAIGWRNDFCVDFIWKCYLFCWWVGTDGIRILCAKSLPNSTQIIWDIHKVQNNFLIDLVKNPFNQLLICLINLSNFTCLLSGLSQPQTPIFAIMGIIWSPSTSRQ